MILKLSFPVDSTFLLPHLWSIDGTGNAPEDIQHIWIPFTTFSPIILYSNLFRASVWKESMERSSSKKTGSLAECNAAESPETLCWKLRSISLLNSRLRSTITSMSVDDQSISAVAYFFLKEVMSTHAQSKSRVTDLLYSSIVGME